MLSIANELWRAEFSLHGGQLLQCFHRDFPQPVIWLGKKASFAPGSAIRGGSPVCWPWFGASPVPGRPAQGFARTAEWELEHLEKDFIRMVLPEENVPADLRDFSFELATEFRVSDLLEQKLIMKNCSGFPVTLSMALHTYFAVSDCSHVSISGLDESPYTVKGGPEQPPEKHDLHIEGEFCQLYCPQTKDIVIADCAWQREIIVSKEGSSSTLVWNPGEKRAAQIADLAPDEYKGMVCVEANRAGADTLTLLPYQEYSLIQRIGVSALPIPV